MNTLNMFPELLSFSVLAPFILRIAIGVIFINLGYLALTTEKSAWTRLFDLIGFRPATFFTKIFGVIQSIGGLMLVAGLHTQLVSIIFLVIVSAEFFLEKIDPILVKRNIVFYTLIGAILISLILTGAGVFAFDLPL